MLKKFESFSNGLSGLFEWVAILGLIVVMAMTCFDVMGTKIFLKPVPGALDFVTFSQAIAIAFAAAVTLIHGRHIQVAFFTKILPKRMQSIVDFTMNIFGLGFFVLVVWQLFDLGGYFKKGGEQSMEIGIPLYPICYAIAVACIPVCLLYVVKILRSFSKAEK
ncbi:MAG: TRAP transporter small permease [Pseudomonadota bacterium]